MCVARVVEDAKEPVKANVDARWLDEFPVVGFERDSSRFDLGNDVAVGQKHGQTLAAGLRGERDAAPVGGRVQPCPDAARAEFGQQRAEQLDVHAADQFGVLLGQGVEGAVCEHDPDLAKAGLVPLFG